MHEHAAVHSIFGLGVPFGQIIQWIAEYGLPLLLQVLPTILSGGAQKYTVAQIVLWVTAALAAVQAGKPLPPLP